MILKKQVDSVARIRFPQWDLQCQAFVNSVTSFPGLKNREYGRRDPSRWPRGNVYPQKLALTSPTVGGRSVGIVRSRAQTTEFFLNELSGYKNFEES
jgi:hypothetical protein